MARRIEIAARRVGPGTAGIDDNERHRPLLGRGRGAAMRRGAGVAAFVQRLAMVRRIDDQRPRRHAAREQLVEEAADGPEQAIARSEEHTSELQSLMRISYAVFCLKEKI